ncbi:MAG: protein kinase [Anaerolineaceae bacterium]|nr:protein kinase [Anaerolineaceae bacterium]MCB9100146.1 protein kinase [Anaerolineales bacterium]
MRGRNPFIYNSPVPPAKFIGRYQEVDYILGSLANPARTSLAISGDPRVGKTSLLHYLRQPEAQAGWGLSPDWCHFIYLDCHNIIPFQEAKFWRYVLRNLMQSFKRDELLSRHVQDLLNQADPDSYDLNNFFDDIAQAGQLVVLLLDEFEAVIDHLNREAPEFLYHLRALVNRPDRGLALIVATRTPLKHLCADFRFAGSSFDNVFSAVSLFPFSHAEVNELLEQYDVDFSATERDNLRRLAGNHPYLVQLTGSLMLRARSSQVIEESTITQIEADLERETEAYFADVLDCCGEQEQMIVTWLSLSQLDQQVAIGLRALLERYDHDLTRLIRRGLVCCVADKHLLFSPIFCRRVLHKNVVGRGQQVLSVWKPYINFLSPPQKEAFKHLVEQIIKRPIIIKKPELLEPLPTGRDSSVLPGKEVEQNLGRYIVEKMIGKANLADIYRGFDPQLGRPVAIKRLSTTITSDNEEIHARFKLEARTIAVLRHPHILQIYDFDIKNSRPYMVMEFIEGQNLKEYLYDLRATERTLSWDEVIRIAARVADALDYAHLRQMIHRDIKPANIMLGNDGGVFLSDFGLVRLLDQPGLTQTGRLIGTMDYMAPEQVRGDGELVDHRADIYSFGCVLYEMITGRPPFTATQLPRAHLEHPPIPPVHFVPDLPELASDILLQALAKDPTKRPASASQLVRDLRQVLNRTPFDIKLSGGILLSDLHSMIIKQLYTESNQANITRVHIDQKFQGGLSGTEVILAQPIDDHGRGLAREVIKIGPATMLRREYNRYRQFVKGRLPATAVNLERGPVELGKLGGLSYGFAGDRPFGTVQDLEDYYAGHSVRELNQVLARLMEPLDDRWYGQSEPLLTNFAEEYDQHLPAHIRLTKATVLPHQSYNQATHRLVNTEVILNASHQLEIGEPIAILGLKVTQVMPDEIKLTSTKDGPKIWIRAETDFPQSDLQEGDQVSILGIIKARRDDMLAQAGDRIVDTFQAFSRRPDGTIYISEMGLTLPDPLAIYPRLLNKQLDGRRAIIHGDLHPGNILIDDAGRAWLIDFDHVREGHVLFDFIRLETILRLFVLGKARRTILQNGDKPERNGTPKLWADSFSLAEYINFEVALLRQTLNHQTLAIAKPELVKAAELILAIRQLAQPYLRATNHWQEYLNGLFLHNLAQLRFYELMPQIAVLPLTTAAVVAGEIS